jgi:PII-like signaling protein
MKKISFVCHEPGSSEIIELSRDSKLLRIFIGSIDKVEHQPLYEAIVFAARKEGLAGATVIRGVMSYGASSLIHTAKLIDISEDMPIIVEIVDHEENINAFVKVVSEMLDEANCGALITIEKAEVLYYNSTHS